MFTPGVSVGDDDHREATERLDVGVRLAHDDQEVADRRVRREPLVPVDHPFVAVAHCTRGEQRRVGAGTGLGHREARAQLSRQQGLEVPLALPRAVGPLFDADGDELGVARVGRVVAEDRRRIPAGAEDLVHEAEPDLTEPAATHLGRKVCGPQALALHLFLHRGGDRREHPSSLFGAPDLSERLERHDLLAHEAPHPIELGFEFRLGREVPGHLRSP